MVFLNPCNDVAFKRFFGSEDNKSITISFLNSILELTGDKTIVSIDSFNTEQPSKSSKDKDTIVDVFCVDRAGTEYIVEMQVGPVEKCNKRMIYYGAKTYSMQLHRAQSFYKLMPVIVLSIVDYIMFPAKKGYKSIHKILDIDSRENDVHDLAFVVVELPKFNKTENELVTIEDKWLYFMKEIKKQNHIPAALDQEELIEVCNIANRMRWSETFLYAYDDAEIRMTCQQSSLDLASEEGEKKAQHAMAKKMLRASTYTIAEIVDITGLTEEEILL